MPHRYFEREDTAIFLSVVSHDPPKKEIYGSPPKTASSLPSRSSILRSGVTEFELERLVTSLSFELYSLSRACVSSSGGQQRRGDGSRCRRGTTYMAAEWRLIHAAHMPSEGLPFVGGSAQFIESSFRLATQVTAGFPAFPTS